MWMWLRDKSNATLLKSVIAVGTIIAAIGAVGAWVDTRYAYAEEVKQYQQDTEETLLLIQLNQLEERVYRELEKPLTDQDAALLFKLQKQIKRLDDRYEHLVKQPPD